MIDKLVIGMEMHDGHENCGTCQRNLDKAKELLNQIREARATGETP